MVILLSAQKYDNIYVIYYKLLKVIIVKSYPEGQMFCHLSIRQHFPEG